MRSTLNYISGELYLVSYAILRAMINPEGFARTWLMYELAAREVAANFGTRSRWCCLCYCTPYSWIIVVPLARTGFINNDSNHFRNLLTYSDFKAEHPTNESSVIDSKRFLSNILKRRFEESLGASIHFLFARNKLSACVYMYVNM